MLARSSGSSFRASLSIPTDELDVYYVRCLCCLVCLFLPCMAWRAAPESDLLRQRVLALNALGRCVCLYIYLKTHKETLHI
jgi:hypothetical protein